MSASGRIEAYLAQRSQMRGLDVETIVVGNFAPLNVSDLREVIAERDRARATAVALEQEVAELQAAIESARNTCSRSGAGCLPRGDQ